MVDNPSHENRLPMRFILTLLLSAFALALVLKCGTRDRWLRFAAMAASSCGDIALMDFRGIMNRVRIPRLYAGAFFFIVAHILYGAAFLWLIDWNRYSFVNAGFISAAALVAAAGIAMAVMLRRARAGLSAVVLTYAYLSIIGAAMAVIFSYAFSAAAWRLVAAAGSLLFFLSDLIIGITEIAGVDAPYLRRLIWWLYAPGQALILAG